MTTTLEIFDGSTTLDLRGSTYTAQRSSVQFPWPRKNTSITGNVLRSVEYNPRRTTIDLLISSTTQAGLTSAIRDLERMIRRAENRQRINEGVTEVVLKYQQGNTDTEDVQSRVLSGTLRYDTNALSDLETATNFSVNASLTLTLEPFGRLSSVSYAPITLENEQDGNNLNYLDIAGKFGAKLTFAGSGGDEVDGGSGASIDDIFSSGGGVAFRFSVNSDGENNQGSVVGKNAWGVETIDESGGAVKLRFSKSHSVATGQWDTDRIFNVDGTEYSVIISYDSGSTANDPTIEVDGVSVTITETTAPSGTSSSDAADNLIIGNIAAGTRTLDGSIHHLALFDGTPGSSAKTTFNNGQLTGTETDLAAYYPINENAGGVIQDIVTGANGNITGATWSIDPDLVGDAGAWLQVKAEDANNGGGNPWNGSKKTWVGIQSGELRAQSLFLDPANSVVEGDSPFTSTTTYIGSANGGDFTTNASGGDSGEIQHSRGGYTLQTGFVSVGYWQYNISTLPIGTYRVLARVAWDAQSDFTSNGVEDDDIGFSLGYVFGGTTKTPNIVDFVAFGDNGSSTTNTWKILDLGELTIPPIASPDDFTDPTLNLRIHASMDSDGETGGTGGDMEWYVDFVHLMPSSDGFFVIDSIGTNDVILADRTADTPGIWLMNTSDVIQSIPDRNGAPIALGPEASRIYWLRDDTGDPSSIQCKLTAKYIPLVQGV